MSGKATSGVLESWIKGLGANDDGIYGRCGGDSPQAVEIEFRERIAARRYDDYLAEVSRHHSVPVMDTEVRRFLDSIPRGGWIADIGGCWGWHWRHLHAVRPDLRVAIVDFVRPNLSHARRVLGDAVGRLVYLIHGDATRLNLPDASFDGYWSVQTLQHVPDFRAAVDEARRILKPGGRLAVYSLNDAAAVRLLRRLLGQPYHRAGMIADAFYLERLSARQIDAVADAFKMAPTQRFTEILFNPDLGLRGSGAPGSALGWVDSHLSGTGRLAALVARQHSLHAIRH